jgi:peroxiredoxin
LPVLLAIGGGHYSSNGARYDGLPPPLRFTIADWPITTEADLKSAIAITNPLACHSLYLTVNLCLTSPSVLIPKEFPVMKKNLIATLLVTSFLFACAIVAVSGRPAAGDVPAPPAIGATIADFSLPDASGKERTLASLAGKNGSVLIFMAVQCPVSNAYNERMEKLAQDYKAKGINVIGINSNVGDSAEAVKAHAAEKNLTFVILKDAGNKIADRLGASVTPEAYFIDASSKLLYRGRIDNSKNPEGVTSSELREALDATLAGKPITKTTANAFGCTIKRA